MVFCSNKQPRSPKRSAVPMISRRAFFAGCAGLTAIPTVFAEQVHVPRIALVDSSVRQMTESGDPLWGAFLRELRRLGYVEGENIVIERWPGTESEIQADIIVANYDVASNFWNASSTTPMVLAGVFESDLDNDFGDFDHINLTGISTNQPALLDRVADLYRQQIRLLLQAVPNMTCASWLGGRSDECNMSCLGMRLAGRNFKLPIYEMDMERGAKLRESFHEAVLFECDAFITSAHLPTEYSELLVRLAIANRLPGITDNRELTKAGVLLCCRPDRADLYRKSAGYVDRLLKGAQPRDIAIERAKFELIINVKTADTIGLIVPKVLIDSASELFE